MCRRTLAKTKETVDPKLVMHFIMRANPEMSNQALARCLDLDPKRLYDFKRGKVMLFDTADRMLSQFGLNYLLYTGDIPITVRTIDFNRSRYDRARYRAKKKAAKDASL